MNGYMKTLLSYLGFIFALLLISPSLTYAAQGPIGVSIIPLKWEINADRGEVIRKTVTTVNPNDFTLKVVPEFQDFRVLEGAGIQWIPADVENPYRMTDWIRISTEPITLKPRGEIELPFTITVPRNASVGGHYAAIFFRAVVDSSGGNVGSIPRVGALIIFNVNGTVNKGGEISEFSVAKFVDQGPVKFQLSLKNTGTSHYEPNAQVSIQSIFGPRIKISSEKGKLIYPGVSRNLKTEWNKKYPLGLYFATLTFIDGDGVSHSKMVWFVGFPWKYVLTVFAILAALRYLYLYLKKRFKIVRAS